MAWDWLSFTAGFAIDGVILTTLIVVLTPRIIERWVEKNAIDLLTQFMQDKRVSDLIRDYVQKRIMGTLGGTLLGGRPKGLKGHVIQYLTEKYGGKFLGGALGGEPPPE